MAEGNPPRMWKKGDRFSASHLNEMVVRARQGTYTGSGANQRHVSFPNGSSFFPETPGATSLFRTGLLVNSGPSGEADFKTEVYWVKAAYLVNLPGTDSTGTTAASFQLDQSYSRWESFPLMVTNLSETTSHLHGLLPLDGTRAVRFWVDYDDAGNPRWVMDETTEGFRPCTCVTNSATVATDYGNAATGVRANLKYDITPFGGAATIAANVAPYMSPGRAYKQKVTAATVGSYFVSGTTVYLYDVNELADDQTGCT